MTLPQDPPPTTVGLAVDKTQVDYKSGLLSRQIADWVPAVLEFQAFLLATPNDTLKAPPFGYSDDNIAVLKSAFTDLALLANIYLGNDALPEARYLGEFSRRLAGL